MTKQQIKVDTYWEVIVYYDVDDSLFHYIQEDLENLNTVNKTIDNIRNIIASRKVKAVTLNNEKQHKSIILFSRHRTKRNYINSIVHEADYVKQSMLKAYSVNNKGENSAYTIGYLVSKMWEVFKHI